MNSWQGINEFVAVAQSGSFTQAAKRLGVSTAHISRQVTALEEKHSTKLFYRSTRKVALTEEGQVFFHHCQHALSGLEEAERAISNLRDTPQGLIKMTAPVAYGEQFIMPLVHDFMRQYPEVEVQMFLSNQTFDLVAEGFDLAIRLGKLNDSSMMAKRLTSRIQYVCASPDYLRQYGAPHTLDELKQHQCLTGNSEYWRFLVEGKERTLKMKSRLNCNSGFALRDAALKGLGIIKLPDYYIANDLKQGNLVEVLPQYLEAEEGIWALYPHNRHLSPKVRLLVDYLNAHLDSDNNAQ